MKRHTAQVKINRATRPCAPYFNQLTEGILRGPIRDRVSMRFIRVSQRLRTALYGEQL